MSEISAILGSSDLELESRRVKLCRFVNRYRSTVRQISEGAVMSEISTILRCWALGSAHLELDRFRGSQGRNTDFVGAACTG